MKTTIQIKEHTLARLKNVRNKENAHSYDEIINQLITQQTQKESLFGILGKKKRKDILKELRDKDDRF